ncbi:MAG TPA: Holliday junction resolvase RuvX [Candidatus Methylomirabilis sp.]|nr:Holliday junction resolvase RuvX [Candidatus Methylomirabilis sp.]
MRALGIDYGSKRVGVALGDTDSKVASPWGVIPNEGALALVARIKEIVDRDEVKTIIVGIPRPLRDTSAENEQVRAVRTFIESLKGLGVEVVEADETLTSQLAARQALEAGEREKRDDLAAAAILQGWLDQIRNSNDE